MTTETRPNVCYGDPDVARDNEILRSVVGSGVHGIAIEGTDDHDEMGVFIEPPQHVLTTRPAYDVHISRTKPEGVRSEAGDTDLAVYSLRRYLGLAIHGNPTVLLPLYATGEALLHCTPLGQELRCMSDQIVSVEAGERFLGYLMGQRERMLGGGKRNRVPNRPELVEQFGYDVKYASHALRLSYQGVELMQTGHLSLPLRDIHREMCRAVKQGQFTLETVLGLIDEMAGRLRDLLEHPEKSPLRSTPDFEGIQQWMISAHLRWWAETGLTPPQAVL